LLFFCGSSANLILLQKNIGAKTPQKKQQRVLFLVVTNIEA